MQPFVPDTQMFQKDQRPAFVAEFWDTPFTPLRNDIASGGIKFTLREPTADGVFDVLATMQGSAAAGCASAFTASIAHDVLVDGRTDNLIDYWAGGAPGKHGASVAGRVAYRFRCTLRSGTARDWFALTSPVTFAIACGGAGYFRVVHTPVSSGTPIDLLFTDPQAKTLPGVIIAEAMFLSVSDGGLRFTSPTAFATGDQLDLYYVQDRASKVGYEFGGYLFKAVHALSIPTGTAGLKTRAALALEAPVIGCGLMDDGLSGTTALSKKTLTRIASDVEIVRRRGEIAQASFVVPLVNTSVTDGIGWEWVRSGGNQAGFLRLRDFVDNGAGGVTAISGNGVDPWLDVKRGRLIRIRVGFQKWDLSMDLTNSLTGFINDFEGASDGRVRVTVLGLSQRMADQHVKNFPDKMSYQCYSYMRRSGTVEPVYDIHAYDNWPLELALRDMVVRSGIDESRTRAPILAPQPDGTTTAVDM